jgi:cytochrome b involved in lipid metabolism
MSSKIIIPIVVIILVLLVGVGVYASFASLNPLKDVSNTNASNSVIKTPTVSRQTSSSQMASVKSSQINNTIEQPPISVIVSVPATTPQTPQLNTFSTSELATFNTEASCYVSVLSKVYDVTAYLDKHPGGRDMLKGCGKVLDGMRHPGGSYTGDKIQSILKDYYIGELK